MGKVNEIVSIVEGESPGLLEAVAREDGLSREKLVRKVLALSRGRMVYTHQNAPSCGSMVGHTPTKKGIPNL